MQRRQQANAVVIRADQRKQYRGTPENPMTYQVLSPDGVQSLAMFSVRAAPGQDTGPKVLKHGGDETMVVLSGKLEVELDGVKQTLGSGDSIFIPRGLEHRVTNTGTEICEAIFVLSPPKY